MVETELGSTVELLYLIWHSIEYCEPFQLPSSGTPSILQVEHMVLLVPVATKSTSGKLQEPCLSRWFSVQGQTRQNMKVEVLWWALGRNSPHWLRVFFFFKFLVFGLLCTRSYSDVMCWMLPHESCAVCSSSLSLLFIMQDAPCLWGRLAAGCALHLASVALMRVFPSKGRA